MPHADLAIAVRQGTEWLMGFDEDGDVYYKHRASGQVVWSQPDEVAAAEQARRCGKRTE